MTRKEYRVTVTKDYLVFASAHFITFAGHRCEPLHGHNYRVAVALEGALDEESWYVVDFSELKRIMRQLCDEIDHKVLLPLVAFAAGSLLGGALLHLLAEAIGCWPTTSSTSRRSSRGLA